MIEHAADTRGPQANRRTYTRGIDWSTLASARAALTATNAFAEGEDAKPQLRLAALSHAAMS